eukprot:m.909371 g.909371  ORF g.909371 m.909371 type:complete len:277 (-) comp23720_c0_seq4:2341-3171(-)
MATVGSQQCVSDGSVSQQPSTGEAGKQFRHNAHQIEAYAIKLDLEDIRRWDPTAVVKNFLLPLGLPHLSELFQDHNINGTVLLNLTKADLKEMNREGISRTGQGMRLGDRVFVLSAIHRMNRIESAADKTKSIWTVRTPEGGVMYFDGCRQCAAYTLCGCCMNHTFFTLNKQGMQIKQQKAQKGGCCQGETNDFLDFRFLKKVDAVVTPCVPCYCMDRKALVLTFFVDERHNQSSTQSHKQHGQNTVVILHPLMGPKAADSVNAVWAPLRLATMTH